MPQDETNEAEVTAAANSLAITAGGSSQMWIRHARAALTAAAQVRERALDASVRKITLKIMQERSGKTRMSLPEWEEFTRAVLALTEPALMPIYGATEDPAEPDIVVQCKCGWRGKQSELRWVTTTTTSYFCPQCSATFKRQPIRPAEPDQGEDVLGMRKGEE